ncbi:MAG: ATP-dependent helicase [Defluviitaleaceae bacterium]|nr:ATP-dependent helicase [Defluviitaleaceae bacterium]
MNINLNLNQNQQQAVEHKNGPMMVLAGPGSGKTAVITARAAHLIHAHNISPGRILVITYSKAAATEMQRRFLQLPQVDGRSQASPTFGTFHSVFYRMIRQRFNYDLGQVLAEGERRIAVRGFLTQLGYDLEDEFLSSVLGEMSLVKNELYDLANYHSAVIGAEDFRRLLDMYDSYKAEKSKIDFDDMLTMAYDMLQSDVVQLNRWRQTYPYIMIDEFQDINRVQYETVKLLAAPLNNLFIVGDDDQSIYKFRGSRPEFLLNFPNDFPAATSVTLDTNYRSTNQIISYANNIIIVNKLRYKKEIIGTGRDGIKPRILTADDQNVEAAKIAERIRKMSQNGANLDSIAVIYRLNLQARAFADAFMNANIPYRNRDEMPVIYDHWIAADFFAYLRLASRLYKKQKTGYDTDAERIINKPYRFIGKAFLQGMKQGNLDMFAVYHRDPTLHTASKARIEELKADLITLGKRDPASAIRYIRQGIGYNEHILDHSAYRKLNPAGLFEIADELQEAAKNFTTAEGFLAHARAAIDAAKDPEAQRGPCVNLTTLHSAKGLEFDRVFIAGAVEDVIPYVRSKTDTDIEEERRLLYVGVTRARHELYISVIKTRYDKKVEPSRFLGLT